MRKAAHLCVHNLGSLTIEMIQSNLEVMDGYTFAALRSGVEKRIDALISVDILCASANSADSNLGSARSQVLKRRYPGEIEFLQLNLCSLACALYGNDFVTFVFVVFNGHEFVTSVFVDKSLRSNLKPFNFFLTEAGLRNWHWKCNGSACSPNR